MAQTHFQGQAASTSGSLPEVGSTLPDFELVGVDLGPVKASDFAGAPVVINIFPSVDTGVCAASVRRFNEEATQHPGVKVLCVSQDLPFALGRFCGAEGIENVAAASAFRSSFGEDFGVTLTDTPLAGLCARAVIVADKNGTVVHAQLVDEITAEPDYDAALDSLKN